MVHVNAVCIHIYIAVWTLANYFLKYDTDTLKRERIQFKFIIIDFCFRM